MAFNEVAGRVKKGSYTGTGANRSITGVGFQPLYTMIRADDTSTARRGNHRSAAVPGSESLFFDALANTTIGITSFISDGFQLGTDAAVNSSGPTYHYLAFENTGGGCSLPGTATVTASGDSWVNQASPSANMGADSVLKVTSKSPSLNTRALVRYSLPSVPSGCSVTSAKLRLHNKSPASGRTLEALQNASSWTENGVTWSSQRRPRGPPPPRARPRAPTGWSGR